MFSIYFINMSNYLKKTSKNTKRTLQEMKDRGEKISMLTAYDYTMASIIDKAGIDVILVGDSASNVMAGNRTTLSITLDQMIYHAQSVVRAVKSAMVIVDMPFGACCGNPMKSLDAAVRVMQETGADAIKIEGGQEVSEDIKKILAAGIPVMSHLGLMPQSIHNYGNYAIRARNEKESEKLISDCLLVESLGVFGILLEKIPSHTATKISDMLKIPTIGIGAGSGVDGQVLVIQDVMGMNDEFSPKFLRRYADLHTVMSEATRHYIEDVKSVSFPNQSESY